MAENSKIEWTKHTANLWHGCTKVHAGCDHCYAETLSKRWGRNIWGNDAPRLEIKSFWHDLEKYQRLAEKAGQIHRVFINSMSDLFEKPMPLVDHEGMEVSYDTAHLRNQLFHFIDQNKYPNLLFLLLTKRPSNINKYIPDDWKTNPPKNVMFGTSPVNQETAEKLIPQLLHVNGKRFLSIEPQLAAIDLTFIDADKGGDAEWCMVDCLRGRQTDMGRPCSDVPQIHWVIQGGESGPNKRPFDLAWANSLKQQCADAGVPYFFKQIDKVQPIPDNLMVRQFPAYHENFTYFINR